MRGTDNVQGQISEHIFAPNGDYCLYYPSNLFPTAHSFENWGERKYLMDYNAWYLYSSQALFVLCEVQLDNKNRLLLQANELEYLGFCCCSFGPKNNVKFYYASFLVLHIFFSIVINNFSFVTFAPSNCLWWFSLKVISTSFQNILVEFAFLVKLVFFLRGVFFFRFFFHNFSYVSNFSKFHDHANFRGIRQIAHSRTSHRGHQLASHFL